jgi:hypothetical protein
LSARLLLEGGGGLGWQPQLEQVARRHRLLAADHHDLAKHGLERRCRHRVSRGRAREQAAQEPARSVHADEPDRAHPRGWLARLGGDLRDKLDAERALALRDLPARAADLGDDLTTHLVPQPGPLRRGERLELQLAVLVAYRHPGAVLLGEHQLDVRSLKHRHLQAAEVDPWQFLVRLRHVPRACRPGLDCLTGQHCAGRCLPGLRDLVYLLAAQVAVTVTGAASPTKHCASPPVA